MMRRLLVVGLLVLWASPAHANPGPYHWEGTGERTIVLSNMLGSEWDTALAKAMAAWNESPYVEFTIGRDVRCFHGRGMVELCQEYAPSASWIGLTGVFTDGTEHITYASVEVNTAKSWGSGKRVYVLCHELGHVLGLYHDAAPTDGTLADTCMVPRFSQSAPPFLPNAKDLADLATMYAHQDS